MKGLASIALQITVIVLMMFLSIDYFELDKSSIFLCGYIGAFFIGWWNIKPYITK